MQAQTPTYSKNGIPRGCGSQVVTRALELDRRQRLAVAGDYQQVDPFAVDGGVSLAVTARYDLAQTDLRHDPPR